jgi:transcriptional regulator with XRE-family HTH domain
MALNLALKTAIWQRGLSQVDIAARAGLHESRLSQIIRGRRAATEEEQKALARVLRVARHRLFPESPAEVAS